MIRFRVDDALFGAVFSWICICILEGGHFSISDANRDPEMNGFALTFLLW
jgi:hypothetical protein